MEEERQIDLTYVTERIISILCPTGCPEDIYLQNLREIIPMLQSKHGHNHMLINLSQESHILTQMNHKVLNTGWLDLHAPGLDQIFIVCMAMEDWLQAHPKHVLVLHSRGDKGQLGVLLASYIHFSNMAASADLSLDHFAMRRFYNDKLSTLMTPSQKRYVWMLGGVLKRGLRMSPSPSFLLCVVLHGLPKIRADGGCCLFLRVYQSLQAVCTSAVYHVSAAQKDRIYFVLQPAQLLKGDIMVVCYDINIQSSSRRVVFRLQFHTGLLLGHSLSFSKVDLDCACADPRFPDDGKVDLLFSESPDGITGRELWHNGNAVTMDYDTLDPLVRRDSYQDLFGLQSVPAPILEPGNESLHSKVRKKSAEEAAPSPLTTGIPSYSDRVPSASSDSGLSVASQGRTGARQRTGASLDNWTQGGGDLAGDESGPGNTINGGASPNERETDILDDEDEGGIHSALEIPSPSSICSLSSETPPEAQRPTRTEFSTDSWVRQQQSVEGVFLPVGGAATLKKERPPPLVAPDTPPRGLSSREAVQRGTNVQSTASCGQEDDVASLATDIDESIEQLNQLILDLDPTFVPVPTRCSALSRSASLQTNGVSHKGQNLLSGWKQQKQTSDVADYGGPQSPGWRGGGAQSFKGSSADSISFSSSQCGHLYKTNSVDYCSQMDSSDAVPPTPAFPVSPPTPYVKHFSAFSQLGADGQWDQHSWTQDSRSFLDGMNLGGGSTEGEMFGSDVPVAPASVQRIFGSMCSVSSGSPLPHTDRSMSPGWHNQTPNSLNSPYPPQPSPPHPLSSPNAHSSPRGASRGQLGSWGIHTGADSVDLTSLLLGNSGLDHGLLDAVDGLESLSLGGDVGLVPLLPEKRKAGEVGELVSLSSSVSGCYTPHSESSLSIRFSSSMTPDPLGGAPSPGADSSSKQDTVKFVQDTSKFWYKPDISRDQAIAVLKDKEPGSFVVRDSHSFRGAYGLAMKVATPPPSVIQHSKKGGDPSNELVRHFLIECTAKGVRLKGCPNEPYFGSLTALVCQHSITPLALPCKLILPDRDPLEELIDPSSQTATNSAAELLKQGAACNVWYLGSVELESLTGQQAVQKAITLTLAMDPPPPSTAVHFKVSAQGITLTDNQRKLFFRRHYVVSSVIFCSLDPQGRKWTRGSDSSAKIFGFVARKSQSDTENVCHLFAEHDPEQPASAIVNFVSKVMIGSHKK
ncbi:si:ch211-191a24.3 isoform X2 [Nothobranchius furzeri]|uniref:si:ch211-191a24.3 isoform X2 n=1 Tax=Nothobranchius furzeri TaxID=105023 RepID=UPI0039047BE4